MIWKSEHYSNYNEAYKVAERLLLKDFKNEDTIREHKKRDKDGTIIPPYWITNDKGDTVFTYSFMKDNSNYELVYFTAEEMKEESRIYPFKSLREERIVAPIWFRLPMLKPKREVTPEELLTTEGGKAVNSLFYGDEAHTLGGCFYSLDDIGEFTIENMFDFSENNKNGKLEIAGIKSPIPQELEQATGIKANSPKGYAKALAKLIKENLTKEDMKGIEDNYIWHASQALLWLSLYEFYRTEDYTHLKKILSSYAVLGLPENWEKRHLGGELTAEEAVLARYFSKKIVSKLDIPLRIREVAEYTKTPLSLMSRAYNLDSKKLYYFQP